MEQIRSYRFTTKGYIEPFEIPLSCKFVSITCIGAGGNGGNGHSRAAGTAGGGGGGGGTGAVTTGLFIAKYLPRIIYVRVGTNGGTTGLFSSIVALAIQDNVSSNNDILISAASGGNGGNGTNAVVGAAGTGGSAAITLINYPTMGSIVSRGGNSGGAGGAVGGANGANVTASTAANLIPGTGGAGCTTTDFIGGSISVTSKNLFSATQPSGVGLSGANGYELETPQYFYGGLGGNSNNTGVGGGGGNGALGCGGGGGAAGVTGGIGGRGGGGLILIDLFF